MVAYAVDNGNMCCVNFVSPVWIKTSFKNYPFSNQMDVITKLQQRQWLFLSRGCIFFKCIQISVFFLFYICIYLEINLVDLCIELLYKVTIWGSTSTNRLLLEWVRCRKFLLQIVRLKRSTRDALTVSSAVEKCITLIFFSTSATFFIFLCLSVKIVFTRLLQQHQA